MMNFFEPIGLWLVGFLVLLIHFFSYGTNKKKEGKNEVEKQQLKQKLENVEVNKKIDNAVSNLDSADVDKQLQKFSRKE